MVKAKHEKHNNISNIQAGTKNCTLLHAKQKKVQKIVREAFYSIITYIYNYYLIDKVNGFNGLGYTVLAEKTILIDCIRKK